LTIKGKAYIAGIYEHPTRHAPDKSTAQLHAEVAKGVIEDAGLTKADIDAYFCAGDAPGGVMPMADYLGLDMKKLRHLDSTDTGGCSYLIHLGHAAQAIAAGKCSIALITLAGKPRTGPLPPRASGAEADFETAYGQTTHNVYGMCAMRHMHDYGTTSEQLAWIKVAASHHAQYNPHAFLKEVVTVEDVINSPLISDLVFKGDISGIKELMKKSRELGMQTFDQSLFGLYESGLISYEDALRNADSLNDLRLEIKLHGKEAKGRNVFSGIGNLDIVPTTEVGRP